MRTTDEEIAYRLRRIDAQVNPFRAVGKLVLFVTVFVFGLAVLAFPFLFLMPKGPK